MPGGELAAADSSVDLTQRVRPPRADGDSAVGVRTPLPPRNSCPATIDLERSPASPFPKPGERFLHFELVEEIGRGSFARVFLARQESLANRLVVLKITTSPTDEPQNLARLQHTNVVPVYSVHNAGPVQALCMPYLGRVTLSQILARKSDRRSGRALFDAVAGKRPTPALAEALDALARLSYLEACLWFVGQLAAGLDNAHARHIVHRDLKPANVLVTDDGVPMLLDFNVSCESARGSADGVMGGTLPYMAPEHLRAFVDQEVAVDERSDLYSLGVILYELLTGRYPYPLPGEKTPDAILTAMIAQHGEPPVPPGAHNKSIPPGVDAIVLKLLDPIPHRRYQTAADLREDLGRQLSHRPLKFARNASTLERTQKWRRRNPGLAVAVLAFVGLALPIALTAVRQAELVAQTGRLQRAEAEGQYNATTADLRTAGSLLGSRFDPQSREHGLALGTAALARYGVGDDPDWRSRPGVAVLDPPQQEALNAGLGELLILMSRAEALKPEGIAAAVRWNQLAASMFGDADRPAVVARHRDEFALRQEGKPIPRFVAPQPTAARDADLYFNGLDLAAADRYAEALPLLARFCDRSPTHFLAWFARGMCHDALNQPAEAATAFAVCVALQPESPFAHANRGLARFKLRRFAEAEADFTRTLELKPRWWPAHLNRGLAREGLRRFADAEQDFSAALAGPNAPTRVYFLRSRVRRAAGNGAGADADRGEGLARVPNDVLSWSARGSVRLAANEPAAALADFDAALALCPGTRDVLLNKASALADHLHREADAIAALDQLLNLYPDHADARCSRGVYHARLGHVPEARRDAEDALKADASAFRQYQVAGLFAQLSRFDRTGRDADRALDQLALAIQAGFADLNTLKTDADLDPIRSEPRFKQIAAAANEINVLSRPRSR